MQLITEEYRNMNKELHDTNKYYGTSGHRYLGAIIDVAKVIQTQDILDYGCGKSTLANNLPFPIKQYDPAVPKHSELPKPADLVVCTDVLEHIEPECVDDVIDHLASVTRIACFITVAIRPAKKFLSDGRNAHLIQALPIWWIKKLEARFEVKDLKEGEGEFSAVLWARQLI
jgi:hypothetical protein